MNQDRQPLLSICIPTYNRRANLERHFEAFSLNTQLLLKYGVEVVICDNASNYDVFDLRNPAPTVIRILRNANNVGFNGNLRRTIAESSGRYLLLLGDDDYLNFDSLERIFPTLEAGSPAGVVSNYSTKILSTGKLYTALPFLKDCRKCSLDDVLYFFNEKVTFMSSLVLRRDCVLDFFVNAELKTSKYFLHIDLLLHLWVHKKGFSLHALPLVTASDENESTYDVFEFFCGDLATTLSRNRSHFGPSAYRKMVFSILLFSTLAKPGTESRKYFRRIDRRVFGSISCFLLIEAVRLNAGFGYRVARLMRLLDRLATRMVFSMFYLRNVGRERN